MSQEHKLNIELNLTDPNRSSRNIGLDWGINLPPRKKNFFEKIFSTGSDNIAKEVVLDLVNLTFPKDKLIVNGSLITLAKDGKSINEDDFPFPIIIDSLSTTFTVFINLQNIKDYSEPHDQESKKVPISFTLRAKDGETDEIIDEVSIFITLELSRIETEPLIEYSLYPEVQFDSTKTDNYIGYITIKSPATLKYAAPINVLGKICATLNQKEATNLIQIKKQKGDTLVDVKNIETGFMTKGKECAYDIFLKMSEMKNPRTDHDTLDVKFMGNYLIGKTSIDNKHLNVLTESCDVLQDTQGAELHGSYDNMSFDNGETLTLDEHRFFSLGSLMKEIPLTFSNLAKDRTTMLAGVKIFNFGISVNLTPGVKLYDKEGKVMDVNSGAVFKLECSKPEIFTEDGVFIPNGVDEKGNNNCIGVKVQFSSKDISTVKGANDYHFEVEIRVTFDYYENKHGLREEELLAEEPSKFSSVIRMPLYLMPNSQWLCVDYGTSAIVCLYDKEIIDLRKRKEAIILKAINTDDLRKDNFEKGAKFLSSDIIFHNILGAKGSSLATEQGNNVEDKDYNELAVFLSPTSSMYINENLRLLPCLKLLVGNEVLPRNKYLYTHEYNRKTHNGDIITVKVSQDIDHETSLMKIDQIFRQSYEALFRYYISKEVPDRNSIHRLVLTYPNTYTPRHIATLRQVVKTAFPSLRMLEFVSESDAVASYYLSHWYDYNDTNALITDNENILVFDMGAGTLDISYIDKSEESDKKINMRILGKLGTSKAGNYLDFILAQIVSDITGLPKSLATTAAAIDEEESADRTKLKLFVKTELKPWLNNENRNKELVYNKFSFKVKDALDHPLFNDFLEACTDVILTRLVNYMNSYTGHLKIDTVLMSGRSCLLKPLQDKLKEAINNVAEYNPRFVVLDRTLKNTSNDTERQKTAVAQGAMSMAHDYREPESKISVLSRRHYASFGVVYEKLGGKKVYCEILNHSKIPEATSLAQFDSEPVKIEGLDISHTITLVQTYLSAKDTQTAIENGDYELVTEMEIIDTAALGRPRSVEIRLRINEFNDIILCFGKQNLVTEGHQPKGDDLQSEETKRSIWPVTI